MNTIEAIVLIMIAIISMPALCKYIQRPSLLNCTYLIIGMLFGGLLSIYTRFMIEEVGKIGFTLLLFLIGLDIKLPGASALKRAIPFCATWLSIQIPLITIISYFLGYGWCFGFISAAGITACSLSIALVLLKTQEQYLDTQSRNNMLATMVMLELFALFTLAASDALCEHGWSKEVIVQALALIVFFTIIKACSHAIHRWMHALLEGNSKWRIHQILMLIFLIATVGERLGLAAPKTAFFLGLFLSAANQNTLKFEEELKPIAGEILIPFFFLSLGSKIDIENIFSGLFVFALAISAIILALRYFIFRKTYPLDAPAKYFLLFCPNITMVAVAAGILIRKQFPQEQVDLLLLTGLIVTVGAAALFPSRTAVNRTYTPDFKTLKRV